jgi:3-hydroxyisobutyrate dehydrogenase-like beta-hydroxyacid dehydrogenase
MKVATHVISHFGTKIVNYGKTWDGRHEKKVENNILAKSFMT